MVEPGRDGAIDAATAVPEITALRERGAQHFDPARFRQLEALARRAAAHRGDLRQALDRRLATLLTAYTTRHEQARREAARAVAGWAQRFPQAAADFERLQSRSEFKALHRLAARLENQARGAPLVELLRHLERQSADAPESADAHDEGATAASAGSAARPGALPGELKALKQFRSTWSRLAVDRQLSRSLARVPENPGPLNSQLLVLRSLQAMQEIAPAYLERFMSYVDALSWLEQAGGGGAAGPANVVGRDQARDRDRKRRAGRGKGG